MPSNCCLEPLHRTLSNMQMQRPVSCQHFVHVRIHENQILHQRFQHGSVAIVLSLLLQKRLEPYLCTTLYNPSIAEFPL